MFSNKNTIKVKWANPKPSSIEVKLIKKYIDDKNPQGKMVVQVLNGRKTLIPYWKYQLKLAQDTKVGG